MATSELLQWANEAAVAAYSYNFANYRKALQDASQYFTATGWNNYQAALKSSRNLETVIAKKLVVSAEAKAAPVIIDQGELEGQYVWKVQMPLLVRFQSVSTDISTPLLVTILIKRVSTLYVPKGIAIDQYIAAPAGTES